MKKVIYEHAGRRMSLKEWGTLLQIPYSTLVHRNLKHRGDMNSVLGEEDTIKRFLEGKDTAVKYTFNGREQTIKEWAREWKMSESVALRKIQRAKTKKDAICWECLHRECDLEHGLGCSWSFNLTMVDGAEYVEHKRFRETVRIITKCPRFIFDKRRKS